MGWRDRELDCVIQTKREPLSDAALLGYTELHGEPPLQIAQCPRMFPAVPQGWRLDREETGSPPSFPPSMGKLSRAVV